MKRILWILLIAGLAAFMYYLFVRPFEFEANFKANTSPGDLVETIRIWNRSLGNSRIMEVDSFSSLKQTVSWKERKYTYIWNFTVLNDSTTKVNVQISEPGQGLSNKLLIPFTNSTIEKDASEIVGKFYEILKTHLRITKVKIVGEVELDPKFCVCRSLETDQIEKANGMMKDFPLLTSFITNFKLKPDGLPMVRISEWNHGLGSIKFDFCFPIQRSDSLPLVNSVTYKEFKGEKVLKAEYYGNYITSDRAWYELVEYAERNGYRVNGMPIEYFHDNPNMGMNESEWKADVFLPIKD